MQKFALDLLLLVLLLLVMGFHFLPHVLHEVLGLVLLGGVLRHLLQSRRWFAALCRGSCGKERLLQAVLLWFLIAAFFTAVVTGMIISDHVFRALWQGVELHRSIPVHKLHIASAYLTVMLLGMHVGMHWQGLWQHLRKIPLLSRIEDRPGLRLSLLACICCAGGAFLWLDQVGERLLLRHIFGTAASRLPAPVYFLLVLGLIGLCALIFHCARRFLQGRDKS